MGILSGLFDIAREALRTESQKAIAAFYKADAIDVKTGKFTPEFRTAIEKLIEIGQQNPNASLIDLKFFPERTARIKADFSYVHEPAARNPETGEGLYWIGSRESFIDRERGCYIKLLVEGKLHGIAKQVIADRRNTLSEERVFRMMPSLPYTNRNEIYRRALNAA